MRPASAPIGLHLARAARLIGRAFDDELNQAGGSTPVWLVLLNLKIRLTANQRELAEAVGILVTAGISARIYNHQLCVLDQALWPVARKSISDWKNEYLDECAGCAAQERCGGLFSSSTLRRSDHIRRIEPEILPAESCAIPSISSTK